MSRQNKKPRLEIVPDEVSGAPGEVEADAIRTDYAVAMDGLRAFVRMGFRLMEVKARLPHGGYMPWCESFLPGLSKSHIHRAKSVAEQIGALLKCPTHGTFENLPPEILALIDTAGSQRGLLAGIHEFSETENEGKAKSQCEARWKKKPVERDEWEPKVLAGDISYLSALRGMLGKETTKDKKKADPKPAVELPRAFRKLSTFLGAYESLTDHAKFEFQLALDEMVLNTPLTVRQLMIKALAEGGAE